MKKNYSDWGELCLSLKKTLLIMRIALVLLLVGFLQTHANDAYAQKTRLSVSFTNTQLAKVLDQIENKSEFFFLYNEKLIDANRKVSIEAKDEQIDEILKILFIGTDIEYIITDRKIILAPSNISESQLIGKKVSGKVTDASGATLPGVSVVVKGTANGVITDNDGLFSLANVPENATLQFSFVGMKGIEVAVGGKTTLKVILEEEYIGIGEVVAVGYGTAKKVNLTGAISTVNLKEVENRPITNSTQALQGVSGVYVNQAGGQPGKDAATIRVRGQGTLNNNDPLVLVDGIEFPLSAVNPNDIESISVLKDAASASIYGNRAANGVILVTTKQGSQNVLKIEYSNYMGFQRVNYLPNLVKDPVEYMKLRNQAQKNAGRLVVDYTDATITEYEKGRLTNPYVYPSNDWLDIMFNDAPIQEHNLRFSGGKDKVSYTLSVGYQNQDGVLMGSSSNQLSVRSNVNFQLRDWIKIGSDFSTMYRYIHEPATTAAQMMSIVFKAQGFHPTYLEDGRYANVWVRTPGHNVYRHPLVWAKEGYLNNKTNRMLMSIYTEIKLPYGINYLAKAGANKYDGFQEQFVPDIYMYQVKTLEASRVDFTTSNKNRHVTNQDDNNLNITLFNTLSWNKTFAEKHNFKALLGGSYESFSTRYFSGTIEGFLGNSLHELNAGSTNPSVSGSSAANYLIGYFGRINYDFLQKYLFEANFRYDGSSKFAEGNRWGFFPSFSAGWRMDQEGFMKDQKWISLLKLRASYGGLGNEQIGDFKYVNMMDFNKEYLFGGVVNPGVAISSYNDPNITWETTTIANLGLDANFFNNRLNFNFEVYDKQTTNILRQVNLPSQIGNLAGPIMNIGTVDNKGYELSVGYQNNIGSFKYKVDAGVNYNTNQVKELDDQVIYNGKYITKEDYSIDSYYLLDAIGIFQSKEEIASSPFQNITTKPGYLKYKDQNGDKVINQNDRVITGGVIPKYNYDLTFNLSYKNWAVTAFIQGVQGIKTYPEGMVATPFWFGTSVTKDWVNDSWTPERPDAKLPIMTTYEDSQNDNFMLSDFWLLDASFLRLKNLQFSYDVPKTFISKIGIKNLLLFVNGQNIFTISKMKDFDPERNIKQGDYFEYPSVKTYTAGLNVSF